MVLRDMDILRTGGNFEVGLSITTANDKIRFMFEPSAPPIQERLRVLDELHQAGIRTFAMLAPLLPGCEDLPDLLAGKVDYVILDRMNYHHADWVYRKYGLEDKNSDGYFDLVEQTLRSDFKMRAIECFLARQFSTF